MIAGEIKVWEQIILHNKLMDAAHWEFVASEHAERGATEPIGDLLVRAGYLNQQQCDKIAGLVQSVLDAKRDEAAAIPSNAAPDWEDKEKVQIDLSDDVGSGSKIEIKAHPESFRAREYTPDESEVIDIDDEPVVFDGEIGHIKDHFKIVQDRNFEVDESEQIDIEEDREEHVEIMAPDAWLNRKKAEDMAKYAAEDRGDGDLNLVEDVPEHEVGDDHWKPSEVYWTEDSDQIKNREDVIDDSERISLDGDDDEL